jgi:hypothetical protein
MFNLQTLDLKKAASDQYALKLRNPNTNSILTGKDKNGKVTTPTIFILGVDSAPVKAYNKAQTDKALAKYSAVGRSKNKETPMTSDDIEKTSIGLAVASTVGWENVALDGETPVEFSEEAAKELYAKFEWMKDQVLEESAELSNFLGK